VRLWEPYGEPWLRGIHKDAAAATSVVFDPTGKLIASGDASGDVLVQRAHGDPVRTLHIGAPIVSLAWAHDGMLLIGAKDGTVHLRLGAGETDTCAISHGSPLVGAALRDDGAVVATAGTDGFVRLWDAKTCRRLRELHPPPGVTSVALDPTGRLLAVGDGSTIVVYDARSGDRRGVLPGHTDTVTGVAFSHDGSQLASSSRDHDARIWNAKTFQLVKLLRRHTSFVSGVAFSSDERWLATAGPLKAGIWASRATDLRGGFMFFVRGNVLPINSIAFSPRGWEVATASRDGLIRVFDCKLCGRLTNLESYARAQLSQLRRIGRP
jgi:WD40 repeat protein